MGIDNRRASSHPIQKGKTNLNGLKNEFKWIEKHYFLFSRARKRREEEVEQNRRQIPCEARTDPSTRPMQIEFH